MSRSAEEDQEVGRENNYERRFDHRIQNPLVPTYTIDDSNAAHLVDLLILGCLAANEDASHGGRGGQSALELQDAPPSYEDVAHAHSETADPPSYEAAMKSPGYIPPCFNQDIRVPVAVVISDPEPTNHPAIEDEDESTHGSRGSFADWVTINLCERFSCCCQNGWQYGPVCTCVIRCLMILFLYFLLKCLVFFIHYIKNL